MTTVNLVANGNFATGDFTDWTLGGNDSNASSPQIFIDTNAEGSSSYAAGMGSEGADGTLSQTIATTPGQTYTLSFWLQNEASGDNDFTAMWGGQPLLALTNASASGYTEYTFTVTALGSTSTLEFSAANGPSQWNLDNISLTAGSSTSAPAAPAISTGAENSNQSVTLTGTAPDGATVTVWDGATALGATSASSTGAWSLTTPDLSLGSYAFTATDATSAGSSAASSPFDVTVTTLPAAPAIGTGAENSNQSVTMTGTAPDGATVTVSTLTTSDGVTTALGTTTASSTGAWSFTTTALSAGSYDFTATDTTSAGTSSASSPFVVGVSSTNPDPITYYVSSEIGSDNNAGTSATAPLASLQAAEDLVQPGDTVEVMNGTYTGNAPGGGDVLDITTSGTASAPITFEAAPGQTPVINSSGGWNAINIEASYIVVEGFTVVGDAANYTSAQALAGYSTGNANLDGNGIAINPNGNVPNHITIENNTVYNEPGGGIYTEGADYVQILNNVVYDNAHWSAYGNSGISVSTSTNSDTNAGVHDIISGNLVFGNAQEVPTTGGNTITDGEGIILDTNPGFTGEILVENNTVYNNGSSGIESFLTDNAVITGNTVYGNNTENVQAASDAQIFINQSNNDTVTSNTTTAPSSTPPAAPVISTGAENSNESVTLSGTAPDGSTVTVSDGGATALGITTASSTGAWSFTTADLAAGSYAFTATDTTSAGTSAASSPFDVTVTSSSPPPAAPVISTGAANSNESVTLTGTAPDGSTVTVSDGGATALGTATASSTGAWSFTTADLAAGSYAFTATDTTSAGTSAASSAFDVTVTSSSPPPAAPVISTGAANSNESVTLSGTAPDGSTVTVSDGGATALGTATASSTGAWSFTTADLAAGSYAFTATDTTSAGTSAASSAFDVTVTSSSPPPAAPVISTGAANSNESVTLSGTAPDGSTVTVSDGGATALGTATASSTGAWSFTTADLSAGSYAFTATDTTSAGTSAASSAFDVTVTSSSPPPSGSNLVANGNFATGDFTDWTLGGNDSNASSPQLFIDTNAEGGSTYAVGMGSMGADGTLSQTIATTAGQTYTLSFWLQNEGSGGNDFAAIWNGQTLLSLTNAAQFGYTEYTYTVTATGSTTTLELSAANNPSQWDLDNISLTAKSTPPPAAPVISTGAENSNESVTLTGTAPDGSTVTVSDGGVTALGTATASSTGAWSFTTADLAAGSYAFTATDTTSAGISAASSAFDVTVTSSSPPPSGSNLVANGNFATGDFTDWTLGGNDSNASSPQLFIDTNAEGGSTYAVGMGSMGADGTLSQTIATTAGQTYTLSFWLQNEGSGGNDFAAIWNGQTLLSLTNAAQSGYTEYTYTVTATGSTTTLELSAANNPSQWDLDNISLTAKSTPPPAAPVISSGVENSNESVTLTGTAPDGSTVTVSDGGVTALGTATASSTGAWSFTTADLAAGSYAFTATDTTSAGNVSTASSALNVRVNANLIGAVTIGSGATFELAAADSASVSFTSSTGTLILESPSTFSGKIFNFTGNGSLSGSDQIDLTNINFNSVQDSYVNGVLTVTDGTNTDKLNFHGSYTLGNFSFASDGSGGTIVYDPPAPPSSALAATSSGPTVTASEPPTGGSATIGTGATLELGGACSEAVTFSGPTGTLVLGSSSISGGQSSNFTGTVSGFGAQDVIDLPGIAFDAQTTLGYLPDSDQTGGTLSLADGAQSAKTALLGTYMASSFAVASDHHGGTMVTEAWQASNQSLLTHPQHA
jgi:parallel beta-helix repeat protein